MDINTANQEKHFTLTYLPLLIRLRCCEPVVLPPFLGSTLHGMLGWALLSHRELYRYLFENRSLGGKSQDIVNPYFIDPPVYHERYARGDELCFGLSLIGKAARCGREVAAALGEVRFFELGAARKKFELVEVLQAGRFQTIWKNGRMTSMENLPVETVPGDMQTMCSHCSVHLQTPLRIRRKGELVTEVEFPRIIRSITRRIAELTERYGGYVNQEEIEMLIEKAQEVKLCSSGLYVNRLERYSSRHKEKMDWSGLMGALTFEGEMDAFTPWLNAARVLHIGRNVTLGYGKVDVAVW